MHSSVAAAAASFWHARAPARQPARMALTYTMQTPIPRPQQGSALEAAHAARLTRGGAAAARRLIVGAYDQVGHQLLGATCSAPIRVLANNDVPSGAAFIQLHLPIRAAWEGWQPHAMKARRPPSPSCATSATSCWGLLHAANSTFRGHWCAVLGAQVSHPGPAVHAHAGK